jgi:L-amino acid N-acyltransferase YncA
MTVAFDERFELADGTVLRTRAMGPDDAPALGEMYATLTTEDSYRRFFSVFEPHDAWLDHWSRVNERGGVALVVEYRLGEDAPWAIVADAAATPLKNGDAELAMTVSPPWRGMLGPYLLDAMCRAAAARGFATLEADILAENRPMLALLRSRPFAVVSHDMGTLRVAISTSADAPSFPPDEHRPRVLVEIPGGWWGPRDAAAKHGFAVLACPGPKAQRRGCPLLRGGRCALVEQADVVVCALRDGEEEDRVFGAHLDSHVPVVVAETSPRADRAPAVIAAHGEEAIVEAITELYVQRGLEATCR